MLLPSTAGHSAAPANPTIAAYAGAPIVRADGTFFGTLCAADPEVQPLGPEHASLLLVLAQLLTSHLERERHAHLEGVLLAARTFEHELNSKLTATIGYAGLLAKDSLLPEPAHSRATLCLESAQELARIVQDVLHVTRVDVTDWGVHGTTIPVPARVVPDAISPVPPPQAN